MRLKQLTRRNFYIYRYSLDKLEKYSSMRPQLPEKIAPRTGGNRDSLSLGGNGKRIRVAKHHPEGRMGLAMDRLDDLEAQSIFIFREAFARLNKLALLWSLGKDSNVMIWLARKAFFGRVPFPALHVDTGKKFPEMYAFRDRYGKEWELDLRIEPCPPLE